MNEKRIRELYGDDIIVSFCACCGAAHAYTKNKKPLYEECDKECVFYGDRLDFLDD